MIRHKFPASLRRLVNELSKLPTVGEKTALKLAYHLVVGSPESSHPLAEALKDASEQVRLCSRCFFLSEEELCSICQDQSRDEGLICVVERPVDAMAIERTGRFQGGYHVLHNLWSPSKGQGTDILRLERLIERLKAYSTEEVGGNEDSSGPEVLIATSTTVEGDATALFIANSLSETLDGIKVSRIAQGMPMGGELEFADEITLSHAIQGRRLL